MDSSTYEIDPTNEAPGTIALEDLRRSRSDGQVILQPPPTADPEDPLNWSKLRKGVNFGLVCFYALMTFVLLDIGTVVWGDLNTELGISYQHMTDSWASDCAGLAIGCVLIIPFAHRYGRRPVYIASSIIQLAGTIWQAKIHTAAELIAVNAVVGIGGAISETIVQMTVADLFFTHQRGTMNGIYIAMVMVGSFLAPVAAGYSADSQGWRWIWWWTAIFLAVNLVALIFFYEESKYVISLDGVDMVHPVPSLQRHQEGAKVTGEESQAAPSPAQLQVERGSFRRPTYWQRLFSVRKTETPLFRHFYQPFIIMTTFPGVTYSALMYGAILAWFSCVGSTYSTFLLEEPYNFDSVGVGLFNLAPFIGSMIGAVAGGPISDQWILWMSRRNRGVFEPEMRLWITLIGGLFVPIGVFVFGLCLARGAPWIVLAIGAALLMFGFSLVADVSLTYVTDCYRDIVGDCLVAFTFIRNCFAMIIEFAYAPWLGSLGVRNMFVSVGCLALFFHLLTVPMIVWGKKARMATAKRYRHYASLQPDQRPML